jgi:hypothetical protein
MTPTDANGRHPDPIDLAADAEAAVVCMLVNGQRHRLSDVIRERHAALLARSGARVEADDSGVIPRVRVTWPQAAGSPVGGCGALAFMLWTVAVFVSGFMAARLLG